MPQDRQVSPTGADLQSFLALANSVRATPPVDFQLLPYTLSPGNVAYTPSDLPKVCDADWPRAVQHLAKGYIAQWLRAGVAPLRAQYQHGPADELEAMADRAEELGQKIAASDPLAPNAALEAFLLSLGAGNPSPHFSTEQIILSPVGVETACADVFLTITNQGRGFLFGEIVSRVSWLQVKSPRFGCFKGKSFHVVVQPHLENLPAGLYEQSDALVVKSQCGEKAVGARIQVLPAILGIDVGRLDFGTVGIGDEAKTRIRVRNQGAGFLAGSVECKTPWVRAWPTFWRVAANEDASIEVEVDTFALKRGETRKAGAVVIESNGGRVELDVRIRIAPPHVKMEPMRLDLKVVDIASVENNQLPTAEVKIGNDGDGLLIGRAEPDEDWLRVEPREFRCAPGHSQQFLFSVANLRIGKYVQAVRIHSNAGEVLLPVWLDVVFSLKPGVIRIPEGRFLRGTLSREQLATNETEDPLEELSFGTRHRRVVIDAAEQPQAEILTSEYWIGKYPVTNAEYAVFIRALGRRPPDHWRGMEPPAGTEYQPVTDVTWHQARAYCVWLSEISGKLYDLPTEAQWEKAARGIDGRIFPWGNNWDRHLCNTIESLKRRPTDVGVYSPNGDSPFGCSDMAGNVWEWTLDWFHKDYYPRSNVEQNPLGPARGMVKVIRGGSHRADAMQARCANRSYANPNNTSNEIGFRIAMKSEPSS